MANSLTSLDPAKPSRQRGAVIVLLLILVAAACAGVALRGLRMENDVTTWLPANDPEAQTLQWAGSHFDLKDRVLISWDGSRLDDPRLHQLIRILNGEQNAGEHRKTGLPQVADIVTPVAVLERMSDAGVPLPEAVDRLAGLLIGPGLLKLQLTEAGRRRQDSLREFLVRESKQKLGFVVAIEEPLPASGVWEHSWDDWSDETNRTRGRQSAAVPQTVDLTANDLSIEDEDWVARALPIPPHDLQVGWTGIGPNSVSAENFRNWALQLRESDLAESGRRNAPLIEECFFAPGTPIAILVTLSEIGLENRESAVEALRRAARTAGVPDEELRMGGSAVAGSALNREVGRAVWNPDYPLSRFHKVSPILLSVIVSVAMAFVMLRSIRLAGIALLVALLTTWMAVAVVPATGATMNMILVVMPTLLIVLTLSAAVHVINYWKYASLDEPRSAVASAMRMAWRPCTFASLTTAIGLLSLTTSRLTPVRDFGLYSAIGCFILLIMVLFGLRSLLVVCPLRLPGAVEQGRDGWRRFATRLDHYHRPIIGCMLVVAMIGCAGLRDFRTETKVIRYFSDDATLIQDYETLEQQLAGIIPVEVILTFDEAAQRSMNFLERMDIVRTLQARMRSHPEISGTLSLADFRPVTERPASDAPFMRKAWYNKQANTLEQRIKTRHSATVRNFLSVVAEGSDRSVDEGISEVRPGSELWRITAQVAIMTDLDYVDLIDDLNRFSEETLADRSGSGYVVTGIVPLFLRTQQAVLEGLIHSFALAFCVIAVVMMFLLRSPAAGLLAMIPNLLPVAAIFGLLSWNGLAVDVGTMITASVALGIAVDGTLHLLTWFRRGLSEGRSRQEAMMEAIAHCGPAMWQTSAIVGVGLLMLYPSDLLLISRFGWLMAALIGGALLADVVLLPSLLASPLGRLIPPEQASGNAIPVAKAEPLGLRSPQHSEMSCERRISRNAFTEHASRKHRWQLPAQEFAGLTNSAAILEKQTRSPASR